MAVDIANKLPQLLEVISEAHEAVINVYLSEDFDVRTKDDDSPVTKADIAANDIILSGLARLFPEVPVVSEEGNELENREIVKTDQFWLVDPLDGTREFIARSGHFTICLALIEENLPSFGIISAPAFTDTYYGGQIMGSYQQITGVKRVETERTLWVQTHEPPIVIGSLSDLNPATTQYIAKNYPDSEVLRVGSQLKLPFIAAGKADVYPRVNSPLHIWDLAAGHAILVGAGGSVNRFDGGPVNYQAENLMAGDFIAQNHK